MRDLLRRAAHARPAAVMLVVVVVHLCMAVLAFDPAPHGGGDNTAYLALARSLLEHGRLLELWDPARGPQTQYPPGFPAVLAVAWSLGARSWFALKLMMLGFSAAAVGLSYLWLRERTSPEMALGLGWLLAVAPGLVSESGWVLSDVPFWAATMGSLLALARGRDGSGIALAFLALSLRTAALPLLVAIVLWLAWHRRWRPAVGVLLTLVAIQVLWTLRAPGGGAPYVSEFWYLNPYVPEAGRIGIGGLLERVLENVQRYGLRFLMRALTGSSGVISAIGGATLIVFAGMGFSRRVRGGGREGEGSSSPDAGPRAVHDATIETDDPADAGAGPEARDGMGGPGLVEVYAVLYVAMLLLWPEQWASDRFLLPFLPVAMAYAGEGVGVLSGSRVRSAVRAGGLVALLGLGIPPSMALMAGAAQCREEVRLMGSLACRPVSHQAFLRLAAWARGRLPADAVVISRKPRQWYWFAGQPGRVYPFSLDTDRLLQRADSLGARYVVLDELGGTSQAYLVPAVVTHIHRFCLIQRVQRADRTAALLGILDEPRDPDGGAIPEDNAPGGLALPICPLDFRSGGG